MPAPMTGRAQTTPKKSRPAALDIQQVHDKPLLLVPTGGPSATAVVDAATPDELQLSSPSELNSSAENSPLDSSVFFDAVDGGDELSAELAELRRKVKTNLRLRPLRSSQSLAALAREQAGTGPLPDSHASDEIPDGDAWQPGSSPSTASSAPSEPPEPDHQQGVPPSPMSSVIDSARSSLYFTPTSAGPMSSFAHDTPHSAHFIGSAKIDYSTYHTPRTPSPRPSRALHPHEVALRCDGFSRPLIIDTRPVPAYLERRIRGSINVAIPTLILKRSKKSGGFATIDIIRQYITTEDGKQIWDDLMGSNGPWDGDVIVYDEDMDERQRDNAQSTAWALLPLLQKHLTHGGIDWIQGGFGACTTHSPIHNLLVSGESEGDNAHQDDNVVSLKVPSAQPSPRPGSQPGSQPGSGRRPGGLFQLNTQAAAARGRSLAVVEPDSTTSLHPPSPGPFRNSSEPPPRSPAPMMNALMPPARGEDPSVSSPAPSQTGFLRPRPPTKKPSLPQLSKLDTRSAERLPKLTLRPVPSKSLSLSMPTISANSSPVVAPPSFSLTRPPRSPSHLALAHSNHMSPPPSAISPQGGWNLNSFGSRSAEHLPPPTPSFRSGFGGHSGPSSPRTPNGRSEPPSPLTARPTPDTSHPLTSDTEEAYPEFAVSTILPNFLYLGPEMTTDEHVDELENLGVRRILNLAFECDDDQGLHLRERFEKYIRIPMRDTVEEDNITMGVKKACEALGKHLLSTCFLFLWR
jgi:hypothetical protein